MGYSSIPISLRQGYTHSIARFFCHEKSSTFRNAKGRGRARRILHACGGCSAPYDTSDFWPSPAAFLPGVISPPSDIISQLMVRSGSALNFISNASNCRSAMSVSHSFCDSPTRASPTLILLKLADNTMCCFLLWLVLLLFLTNVNKCRRKIEDYIGLFYVFKIMM